MPSSVVVTAPARLHLGFLDMHGRLGRRFGSLGLTIEGFATRVRIEPASETMTVGEAEIERAARVLDVLRRQWDVPHVRLTIERTIPAHVGMGSGTQLGLAVGTALATLFDVQVGPAEIARLLERVPGQVSVSVRSRRAGSSSTAARTTAATRRPSRRGFPCRRRGVSSSFSIRRTAVFTVPPSWMHSARWIASQPKRRPSCAGSSSCAFCRGWRRPTWGRWAVPSARSSAG